MRLFSRSKAARIDEEEQWALLGLPYAADLGWDLARLRRVRDLEEGGVEFTVRRPAHGNQAVLSMASFPTKEELTSLLATEFGGGLFTLCAGARVLCTYRLAGPETSMGTSGQRGAGTVRSFRHRVDELLADRLEDALDANPELAREVIEAAVRTHYNLPSPEASDPWDDLALEEVRGNVLYREQLVAAYLAKHGIMGPDEPKVNSQDQFIEQLTKDKKIRELLLGDERGGSNPIAVALLGATKAVVASLNNGQLLEAIQALQQLRTQPRPHDPESTPPHEENPAPDAPSASGTGSASTDSAPEVPPIEPAPSPSPKQETPDQPRSSDWTTEGRDLLEAARSIDWRELLQEVQDGPGSFIERAHQVALEAPEMPLGRVFRALRDSDPATVVEGLRQARPFLLEDPFKTTIIERQGQTGFDAAVQIINFLTTDAGTQWLASARQMALGLGIDEGEGGHEGVRGGSERPTVEEGEPK